jgi:16S rRNA (guanine527-N7)-methyltransferase
VDSNEFRERLTERANQAGVHIPADAFDPLERYYRLLAKWNEKINLTALPLGKPTDDMFDRLLVEPLATASQIEDAPTSWFDLGSGGGSPGIPIKIVRPRLRLTMVESRARKATFLREVIRELQLGNATVENIRVEALMRDTETRGSAQLVTVRAVKVDQEFLGVCRALLAGGGTLILLGSSDPPDAINGFETTSAVGTYRRCST